MGHGMKKVIIIFIVVAIMAFAYRFCLSISLSKTKDLYLTEARLKELKGGIFVIA